MRGAQKTISTPGRPLARSTFAFPADAPGLMSKRLKCASTKPHARRSTKRSTANIASGIHIGRRAPTRAIAATCAVTSSGDSWWLTTMAR